jgi:ferredoxin-type protein NapG
MAEDTRRSFLGRAIRLAATALGMTAAVLTGHALLRGRQPSYPANRGKYGPRGVRLIRPPGAVEEGQFLAGCIRCYRCQDACERGAIQFFSEAHGELYHTPYVDPAIVACNICMKCTHVCPTGVLRPMEVEQKAEVEMANVVLNVDTCLSYKAEARYDQRAATWETKLTPSLEPVELPDASDDTLTRRGPCGECYMVCPLKEKAITRKPGEFFSPEVHTEHCIGCGLCEEICRQLVRGNPAIRVVATRGKET